LTHEVGGVRSAAERCLEMTKIEGGRCAELNCPVVGNVGDGLKWFASKNVPRIRKLKARKTNRLGNR